MTMTYVQENRWLTIESSFGSNKLLLTKFEGQDAVSGLFDYDLTLQSPDSGLDPRQIVGQDVTVSVQMVDGSLRHFHGYISQFSRGSEGDHLSLYRARMVPWTWFLTRRANCRIFQDQTAVDIIRQVLGEESRAAVRFGPMEGSHPERTYCVQYRETDFDFVSRLMEEEGIFYFFRQEHGKHTMVVSDSNQAFEDCSEYAVRYVENKATRELGDHITSWEHHYSFFGGGYAHTDYNPETSREDLASDKKTGTSLSPVREYEVYDYPGKYTDKAQADYLARVRMEEADVAFETVDAESCCRSFFAGGRFTLAQHHDESEQGRVYAITSIFHAASQPAAYVTGGESGGGQYRNRFLCIPEQVPYRPARRTQKPTIRGAQTALVVGPPGEEIYVDEMCRIKVEFYWDRRRLKNEDSSCWIRVAQMTAGTGFGTVAIPRIGHEVLVHFLEGDPDRPLIMGSVYNDANVPPASNAGRKPDEGPPPKNTPEAKTMTTVRSNSFGQTGGHNEITMNDLEGKETLYFKAQHNENHDVGNDRRDHVVRDEIRDVDRDRTLVVGRDEKTTIKNDRTEIVEEGDETLTIKTGDRTITVETGNDTLTISSGSRTITVKDDASLTVTQGNRTVGVDQGDYELKAQSIRVTGLREITLTVGGSSLKIDPSGVVIQAPAIKLN